MIKLSYSPFVVWNFYEKTVDKFFEASMISYFVSETKVV
jgi:hypothetical protein